MKVIKITVPPSPNPQVVEVQIPDALVEVPAPVITQPDPTYTVTEQVPEPVNKNPIAVPGTDQIIQLPSNLILNGLSSSDPDGTISSYKWAKVSGPAANILSPDQAMTEVISLAAGDYIFSLTVIDNKNASDTKTLKVTVKPSSVQTTIQFTPSQRTDDYVRPGAGAEQWHGANTVNIPVEGVDTPRADVYYRMTWNKIETDKDVYNFAYLDSLMNGAIDRNQKFGFGVMTTFPDNIAENGMILYDNGYSAYPLYFHNLMQSEVAKDFRTNGKGATTGPGAWIPNCNSQFYIARLRALNLAINNHLETGSYKGVVYKDIINYVDLRGYGSWGEWHSGDIVEDVKQYPAGTRPTLATLKAIVDAHTQTFQNFPLVAMIAAFDANYLPLIMNPPEIADYILSASNKYGPIGWRRDQWGATDSYLSAYLENNDRIVNPGRIMDRWKTARIVGEPPGWAQSYNNLQAQVRLYHAHSFGNGNYGIAFSTSEKNYVRAAAKDAGYRLSIVNGSFKTGINELTVNWTNIDRAPTLDQWKVIFEFRQGSAVVRSHTSSFQPRSFIGTKAVTETISGGAIPPGVYDLWVRIVPVSGYGRDLPLAISTNLLAKVSI
jgi:hypothetical protein